MSAYRPQVRRDLLASEVADELVVYDTGNHRAHCLTPAARQVWSLADGTRTVDEIAAQCGLEAAGALVPKALDEMAACGLLDGQATAAQSRRRVLRKAAAIAAAPLVLSLVAPLPADAASGVSAISPNTGVSGEGVELREPPGLSGEQPPAADNAGNPGSGGSGGNSGAPQGTDSSSNTGGGTGGRPGGDSGKNPGGGGSGSDDDDRPSNNGNQNGVQQPDLGNNLFRGLRRRRRTRPNGLAASEKKATATKPSSSKGLER